MTLYTVRSLVMVREPVASARFFNQSPILINSLSLWPALAPKGAFKIYFLGTVNMLSAVSVTDDRRDKFSTYQIKIY